MFVANDFNYTDTSAIAIIGFSFRFPNDHNNECTFWQALKDGEKPKVVSDPHAQKPSGFIGSIVRWGYYMMDYTFGYAKSVYPKIATKAKVFIFDRYYYDYYIDQRRSRTSLPRWVLRFGEIFVPVPDLILPSSMIFS
jgi:hypothetical protein